MKTGIFGGTFNPPHNGHLRLVTSAADRMGLDRVIIIPDCVPPHKAAPDLAPAEMRLEMCRRAFGTDERFTVSSIEIDRGEKSYTYDTLCQLHELFPDDEFVLIIGSDMLTGFTRWYRYGDIFNLCTICAASRETGYTPDLSCFTNDEKAKITFLETEAFEVSSSELRNGGDWDSDDCRFVCESVKAYVREKGLYSAGFGYYEKLISDRLDSFRLEHSHCVAAAAEKLAVKYGCDRRKAYIAGLLHDVAKNDSREFQREIIEKGGHTLTGAELANPKVWHAMAGENFLRLNGIISDAEILSSIYNHTTGAAGMTLLEKIVYIADFISDDRSYPDVGIVRKLAEESLEKAILYTSSYTIKNLAEKQLVLHPATVECYNDTLINLSKKG